MSGTPSGRDKRPLESPGTPSPIHKQSKMAETSQEQSSNTSELSSPSSSSASLSVTERMDKMMEILLSVRRGQESLQKTFDSKIEKLRQDVMSTIADRIKAVEVDVDLQFASLETELLSLSES